MARLFWSAHGTDKEEKAISLNLEVGTISRTNSWVLKSRQCFFFVVRYLSDIGSNNSGYYELAAVLTHQGRSSSSGHYLAWIRRKGGIRIKSNPPYFPPRKLCFCAQSDRKETLSRMRRMNTESGRNTLFIGGPVVWNIV